MQKDTKILQLVSWTAGAIENLAINPSDQDNKQLIIKVDKTLQDISIWVTQNDNSEYYIGVTQLSEDFATEQSCWNTYKEKLSQTNQDTIRQYSLHCYDITENLAIIIEKMVYLKQNKIINMFYLSLTVAMILLLLVIYFIRTYIHLQMKKHAIHDHETTLFNHKYFSSELKSSCARAIRHKYPLSIMQIEIEGFEKGSTQYDKHAKLDILKAFGTLMYSLVRDGDLPSRYDENHFLILLPYTNEENALLFEKRIRQAMMQDDCIISENIKLNFTLTEFDKEETKEEFVKRALK